MDTPWWIPALTGGLAGSLLTGAFNLWLDRRRRLGDRATALRVYLQWAQAQWEIAYSISQLLAGWGDRKENPLLLFDPEFPLDLLRRSVVEQSTLELRDAIHLAQRLKKLNFTFGNNLHLLDNAGRRENARRDVDSTITTLNDLRERLQSNLAARPWWRPRLPVLPALRIQLKRKG
jgi:hypothetical protein